jgi:hypothetical protein
MHMIYVYLIFLLDLFIDVTHGTNNNQSNITQTYHWSNIYCCLSLSSIHMEIIMFFLFCFLLSGCYLTSEHRLECRNLFNFYLSAYSLCADDEQLFVQERIDELIIAHDYHCFDRSYQCYFEFDSTWSTCFHSLKKLIIENLSFIVHLYDSRRLLPIDYLKIVNTHGSITELLHLFQFSNRSSIYIDNAYPRWSGMDLYAVYSRFPSIRLKQLWINVYDWYPIVYMRYDQQLRIRQWLTNIYCMYKCPN